MMMREISLHVLDIVQNSIAADATLIEMKTEVWTQEDKIRVSVLDNGIGMDEEQQKSVLSPFTTSRTTRRVGLGIPMFAAGAEAAGGAFLMRSKTDEGTYIEAEYQISHIDRPPLGNMAQTVYTTVICHPDLDFVYIHKVDREEYRFDTREIRQVLGPEIPLYLPEVSAFIKEDLEEGIHALYGGVEL